MYGCMSEVRGGILRVLPRNTHWPIWQSVPCDRIIHRLRILVRNGQEHGRTIQKTFLNNYF
jgi:hypothetical protein